VARVFNGTNQSLQSEASLSTINGASRIAIAFELFTDFENDDDIILELSANSNSNQGTFKVIGNESGSGKFYVDVNGNVGKSSGECTAPSDNTYHSFLIEISFGNAAESEVESIFIDGNSQTLTHTNATENTGNFGDFVLNVMSRNNAALFADGKMRRLAIWTPAAALGETVADALAGGATPPVAHSADLVHYWPLAGTDSPEPDTIGTIDLNVNGATGESDGTTFTKDLGGTITPAGAPAKQDQKPLSGSMTPAGALLKVAQKVFAGSISPAAAIAAIRSVALALGGTIAPAGSLVKSVSKRLTGLLSLVGSLILPGSETTQLTITLTDEAQIVVTITDELGG
jgi:hypothetical protein